MDDKLLRRILSDYCSLPYMTNLEGEILLRTCIEDIMKKEYEKVLE
jgi:hypothetical protein